MLRFLTALALLTTAAACVQAPEFPIQPEIAFVSLSSNDIYQFTNGPVDSVRIHLTFTDGDGDISSIAGDSIDVILTDSRVGTQLPLRLPEIPSEGTANGISGDIFINLINTTGVCCISNRRVCAEDPDFPTDTVSYAIQIRDRAGNFSNVVQTPPITILCLGQ